MIHQEPTGLKAQKVLKLLKEGKLIACGLTLYKLQQTMWMKYPGQRWVVYGSLDEFKDEVEDFETVLYYNEPDKGIIK